jgi:uncharacterized protein
MNPLSFKSKFALFLFGLCSLEFFNYTYAQKPVPELWGVRVHDDAHALKQETVDQLERELKAYEDSTSNQIAILIVHSLDGEVLETYSLEVAEKWKLGKKDKDNGVLLLVAVDDHKIRIEVGQGLEGVLTDAQSSRIVRNEVAPEFRRGDYDAGIKAGITGIIKAIAGEYKADDTDSSSSDLTLGERILVGGFILLLLGIFTAAAIFSQGCAGWGLYIFLIPFYLLFPWVALGYLGGAILLIVYLICTPIAKLTVSRSAWGERMMTKWKSNNGSGSSGGGWAGGGSSGGSSWSSGGSSFSGGGGSFGGGGSSGGW